MFSFEYARKSAGMTQNELAKVTGISQADISKLENGSANPSLKTLERLAAGLGMELKIEFVPTNTLHDSSQDFYNIYRNKELNLKPKYEMTREQNVFVAKRNIVDYIYKSAQLEGLEVTYPDTDAIFNGMSVSGVKISDVIAVNNLKNAWQFLLDNLSVPLDYAYICKLNQLVGGDNLIYNAGYVRTLPVSIGGTSWKPDIPIESDIKKQLSDLLTMVSPTERAIDIMLYCMRGQFFLDGNKRTAMLAANKEMITHGQGIISIPVEIIPEFTPLLVEFYETGERAAVKSFIYENCIDGLNF